jgi:hypothetical protein
MWSKVTQNDHLATFTFLNHRYKLFLPSRLILNWCKCALRVLEKITNPYVKQLTQIITFESTI